MAISWPTGFQDRLNQDSFTFNMGKTTISSDQDIGPVKTRRRFTKAIDKISCSIFITKDEVQTFYDFYNTTLNGGISTFEFLDPFTETIKEYKFDTESPPSIAPVGGNVMNLTMTWVIVP